MSQNLKLNHFISFILLFALWFYVFGYPLLVKYNTSPSKSELKIGIYVRVIQCNETTMEVYVVEDQEVGDTIYEVNIEDCKFYIDKDVLKDQYPVLIVPEEPFNEMQEIIVAKKIYGFSN